MDFPSSNYTYGAHGGLSGLDSPPVEFWPVYCCITVGHVTRREIEKTLDNMLSRGMRGVYVYPITNAFGADSKIDEDDYLGDAYMDMIAAFVEEAEARGMNLWMYDEAGWPSGAADGLVVKNNPELSAIAIDKDGNISKIKPLAQPYPDLMNPRSAEEFIRLTHKRYDEYFGGLGNHFALVFTDEPEIRTHEAPDTIPWSEGFAEEFIKEFGYDLTKCLPLFFDGCEMTDEAKRVRADYHDLVSRLFVKNFFLPIRDFCREHGSLLTGHVAGDDVAIGNARWGYHHILRCLRAMDVPGVDMIWRQIYPGEKSKGVQDYAPMCANGIFPRYASSAAHQTGAGLAMSESFAIYGSGLSYAHMRWLYNFQAVRGINLLNPMNTCISFGGRHAAGSTLRFAPETPGESDLALFNLWAARVSYAMSAGKPICDSALYMPLYDIWAGDDEARSAAERFEALGEELERRGCDFDVIDDDAILGGEVSDGALVIGNAAYSTIYIGEGVTLPERTRARLDSLSAKGVRVVKCRGDYEVNPIILSSGTLCATRRKTDEGTLYLVTNEAHGATCGEAHFPRERAKSAVEIDLVSGKRRRVSVAPYAYDLAFGEERLFIFDDMDEPADALPTPPEHAVTLSDFEIKRLCETKITRDGPKKEYINEDFRRIPLGDWREELGEYFSGDCLYRTHFHADEEMRSCTLTLDCGEVLYSVEAFLNGESLGVRVFPPFRFTLTGLKEENELCIRVSNTACNARAGTDYDALFPGWRPDFLTELLFGFERDSLPSGLVGPIKLLY